MNIFQKAFSKIFSKKTYAGSNFFNYAQSLVYGGVNVSSYQAIEFYKIVAPVFTAIEIIANEVNSIKPHIWDMQEKKFNDEIGKELLELFRNPNSDIVYSEYIKKLASYFLITGNSYQIATGDVIKPPKELYVIEPSIIDIQGTTKDIYPSYYKIQKSDGSEVYKRAESVNFGMRFYNDLSNRELWQIKSFNPTSNNPQSFYGMSKLNSIYYEIKQHLNSSIHNLSLLEKGARSSGAFTTKSTLTNSQRDNLKQEISEKYQGQNNAGRIMFLDGDVSFLEMSKSLKDMDFRLLKNDVAVQIYLTLGIPLPLVINENMTMNNYKEAKLALYDNSVLPLVDRLFLEDTNFLFPRYKLDTKRYRLFYNILEIPALESRRIDNIKNQRESGVLLINEIRALYGYPPISGGDVLYQQMSLVPLGSPIPTQQTQQTTKQKFVNIVESYKDSDGKNIFTSKEINEMVEKYNLR